MPTDYLNVRWTRDFEVDLRMKLRIPDGVGPFPFVVFAHGFGTPYDSILFDAVANELVSRGIAWVSVQYNVAPDAVAPLPMQQVWGAIRFLRYNIATYNLKPSHCGVMGSSAGSALMAQVATQYDTTYIGSFAGHTGKNSNPQAMCLVSACVFDPDLDNFSPAAKTYIAAQYGCADIDACPATSLYLPQFHLSNTKPPALVIAGDLDTDIPLVHSENTVAAMVAAGMTATLLVNTGYGHGWINGQLRVTEIADFFQAKLT